jgi:hypothetical protein
MKNKTSNTVRTVPKSNEKQTYHTIRTVPKSNEKQNIPHSQNSSKI